MRIAECGIGNVKTGITMWAVVLLIVSSCGYHFTSVGGIVPEGAKTIALPVFINATYEPYIDVEVTKAVVEEFLTDGRLAVTGLDAADLILHGSVTKFDLTPASYSSDNYVASYNVSIGVNISIEDRKTGKILLQDKGVGSVFISSYSVTLTNISSTKIQKETAVKNACKDLASSIRSRVLEGF
jgi:hypothetical protein